MYLFESCIFLFYLLNGLLQFPDRQIISIPACITVHYIPFPIDSLFKFDTQVDF